MTQTLIGMRIKCEVYMHTMEDIAQNWM